MPCDCMRTCNYSATQQNIRPACFQLTGLSVHDLKCLMYYTILCHFQDLVHIHLCSLYVYKFLCKSRHMKPMWYTGCFICSFLNFAQTSPDNMEGATLAGCPIEDPEVSTPVVTFPPPDLGGGTLPPGLNTVDISAQTCRHSLVLVWVWYS